MGSSQLPSNNTGQLRYEMILPEEYDIVLSFAGEDRPEAEALAESLRYKGVKVFYDQYEKASLWGKNLYSYLSDLYQKKARYCVMLISRHYANKLWTNHEREAAQARAFQEHQEYVLPVRLDDTEIPGILSTVAYLNWNEESSETISDAIVKKLNYAEKSYTTSEVHRVISPNTTSQHALVETDKRKAPQKTKQQLLSEADNAYNKMNYRKALEIYSRVTDRYPACAAALNGKGNVLSSLGRYSEALAAYKLAIQFDPYFELAHVGLGMVYHRLQRFEDAWFTYKGVIERFPNCAAAYNGRGDLLFDLDKCWEALQSYEEAIKISPGFVSAYVGKGKTLRCLKQYEDALVAYEQALHLDSKNVSAWKGKANVLADLKQYEKMIIAYKYAIKFNPQPATDYFDLGNLLAKFTMYDKALINYEQALHLDPLHAPAWKGKGDVLHKLGRDEEALVH